MNKTLVNAVSATIIFILMAINLIAKTNFQLSEDALQTIATLIAVAISWFISLYWNQDFTKPAKKYTKVMRKAKKLLKEGDATLVDLIDAIIEEMERKEHDN